MKRAEIYGYVVQEDGTVFGKRGKALVPSDNGRGYLFLALNYNGRRITKAVHRLVAEAFIPNPEGFSDVNHRDGNKLNNDVSNLEWMTHGENIAHAYALKLRSAVGEMNARCLTDAATVRQICTLLADGRSAAAIRDLGFDYSLVRKIKSRATWQHISADYVW